MNPHERLELLGREVAEELGEAPRTEDLAAQRQAIVTTAVERSAQRHRPILFAVAALASTAMAVAAVIVVPQLDNDAGAEIAFTIGQSASAAHEGVELDAVAQEPLNLSFSDGSRISLAQRGRGRVIRARAGKVRIRLDEGSIAGKVQPDTGIAWRFEAGPFETDVVGTMLEVAWQPKTEELRVRVTEGLVRVGGPHLGPRGVEVAAGRLLSVNARTGQHSLRSEEAAHEAVAEELPEAAATSESKKRPRRDTAAEWVRRARAGDFQAAMQAARKSGLARILRTANLDELGLLADTARYTQDTVAASKALRALLRRYPTAPRGRDAAFMLGRLAMDEMKDAAKAARWLRNYLSAQPNGTFAQEARGRLIGVLDGLGETAAARKLAQKYLEQHPKGAYVRLAKSVLSRGE